MDDYTRYEDELQLLIQSIEVNVDELVVENIGNYEFKEDVAGLNVMANLAIAHAINNLSRSIRDSFGASTEGAAFLEKIAMILESK